MKAYLVVIRAVRALRVAAKQVEDELLQAEWEAVNEVRSEHIEPLVFALQDYFTALEANVLSNLDIYINRIDEDTTEEEAIEAAAILMFGFDQDLQATLELHMTHIMIAGFVLGAMRVDQEQLDWASTAYTDAQIRLLSGNAIFIESFTLAVLANLILDAIRSGATAEAITSLVSDKFADWAKSRVDKIATSQGIAAFETGQVEAYRRGGAAGKVWISVLIPTTREWHFSAHGQIRRLDDFFDVGPDRMSYPGDPSAIPENTINCLCTTAPYFGNVEARSVNMAGFTKKEVDRILISIRDRAIREAYPMMRDSMGSKKAYNTLAEKFNISVPTAKNAVWDK